MKYSEFEDIISQQRMRKYLLACNNDSKKAMTLYRYNLKLSQEMSNWLPILVTIGYVMRLFLMEDFIMIFE